jgi:hypothetical protein
MNLKMMLPLVLVAAAATPASANWFSNPSLGINRCVCTAPSPTPEQVRADKRPPFVLREQAPAVSVADASAARQQQAQTQQQAAVQPVPTQPVQVQQAPAR